MPNEQNDSVDRLIAMAIDRSRLVRADLAVATVDLFLPYERRLTDQQRALTGDVLHKLVRTLELDLRQRLVEAVASIPELRSVAAMLANSDVEMARPELESNHVFRDEELMSAVLQRAEEHRIARAIAAARPQNADMLEALLRSPDTALARRANEYVLADSRRHDRFREPMLSLNDLPRELAYRLYWWIAAALRRALLRDHRVQSAAFDNAAETAVRGMMADHSEGHGAIARAMRLAARLHELGDLTDDYLVRLLSHAQVTVFATAVAARSGISFDVAWRAMSDLQGESLLVLVRAIGMTRDAAAAIVQMLDETKPSFSPASGALSKYDDIDPAKARDVLRFWQRDAGYRAAIDQLGTEPAR